MAVATLELLLQKKLQREQDKMQLHKFHSEVLDLDIEVHKRKAKEVTEILEDIDEGIVNGMRGNLKLIYTHCPIFKDKELQKAYNCAEPYDVIMSVLDENLGEMNKLLNFILNLYGLGEIEKDREKETDAIKN